MPSDPPIDTGQAAFRLHLPAQPPDNAVLASLIDSAPDWVRRHQGTGSMLVVEYNGPDFIRELAVYVPGGGWLEVVGPGVYREPSAQSLPTLLRARLTAIDVPIRQD